MKTEHEYPIGMLFLAKSLTVVDLSILPIIKIQSR